MSEDQLFFYFQPYKITYIEKTSFSPDVLKNQDNTDKAILGQYFHDPLHHLDPQYREVSKNSIPQRVKTFKMSYFLSDLLRNYCKATCSTLTTHYIILSWITVPKNSVPQKHKTLKGSYCACSGITSKPPAVYRRPIFNPKSPFLKVHTS